MTHAVNGLRRFFSSIRLTVGLLFALFFLVLFATFAQVDLGIFEANKKYFTSWFIWMHVAQIPIPIFLGGYTIGVLLVVNLIASHTTTVRLKPNKIGLFLIHFGLILLIIGSGLTSLLGQEMQIAIKESHTKNYVEFPTEFELVFIDTSATDTDTLTNVPIATLKKTGRLSYKTFDVSLNTYHPNAIINQRGIVNLTYTQMGHDFKLIGLPKTYKSDERNIPGIDVTIQENNAPIGRFIFWGGSDLVQELNKTTVVTLRPKRDYLDFSVKLNTFSKHTYDRSTIAKAYESNLSVLSSNGQFDTVVSMNQPLRFKGYTFFQASFTPDETTSVFQVVKNPSWIIPYISSALIVFGLLIQMQRSTKRGTQ